MQSAPAITDPLRMALDIQAQRLLDAPGPTTWHKLLGGDTGHVRILATELLENEKRFRAALARWYKAIGKKIVQAIADRIGPVGRLSAAIALTLADYENLRAIVQSHVTRAAIISASIEWQMHQRRTSAKSVIFYLQKGLLDFARQLPARVVRGIKLAVAGVMAVFLPGNHIDPILDKVEQAIIGKLTKEPTTLPKELAEVVSKDVFNRAGADKLSGQIAVTTGTQGANVGTGEAGKALAAANLVNAQRWMTLHGSGRIDSRVRPSHRKANGQTVAVGQKFTLDKDDGGSEQCECPGDPSLSAGNLRFCRCLRIFVYVEHRVVA